MKSLSVILLLIIFFKTSYPQSEWKWIAPNPPNKMVYSSTVADNKAYFWCQYNSVIKLDFETETFEVLPTYAIYENCDPGDFASQGIAFADSMRGYITDGCHGEFRTTDGGLTWVKTSGVGSSIEFVTFGSSQVGWKLGGGGIYKTTNAGMTWTQSNIPSGGWYNGGVFSRMYAINKNQLWILKKTYYNGIGADVWYTSNGGNSWSKLNTGLISDSLNQVSYYDIKMDSSGIGYLVGSIYQPSNHIYEGFISKTTDMGVTWSTTRYSTERFEAILLFNENEALVLGNQGYYSNSLAIQRKTMDAGNTWILSSPLSGYTSSSDFYDAIYTPSKDLIYMFASFGFYRSSDRGASYEKITSETDVITSDIVFEKNPQSIANQMAIAFLQFDNKPFLLSLDGGHTWNKKELPNSIAGYLWQAGIAEGVIYIIVDQTRLYKSTDQGNTWNYLSLPVWNTGLQALKVYNKDILTLKAYKNLVSSSDGGITWILGPTIENIWWKSTAISSPGSIIGAGKYYDSSATKGFIFSSSDYGLSWYLFDTKEELSKAIMTDERVGYILGGQKIYKTSDSGVNWKATLTAGSNEGFSQLAFSDSLIGIVASGNPFKITTNGGKNWTNKDFRLPIRGATSMEYNDKGDLFIISGGALIMIPSNHNPSPEIQNLNNQLISGYYLSSSFPNPFNSSSTIKYYIPSTSQVTLKIFNTLGEEIETLVDEIKPTGTYQVTWNAKALTSGVYFYRLQAGSFVQTRKMILLK